MTACDDVVNCHLPATLLEVLSYLESPRMAELTSMVLCQLFSVFSSFLFPCFFHSLQGCTAAAPQPSPAVALKEDSQGYTKASSHQSTKPFLQLLGEPSSYMDSHISCSLWGFPGWPQNPFFAHTHLLSAHSTVVRLTPSLLRE